MLSLLWKHSYTWMAYANISFLVTQTLLKIRLGNSQQLKTTRIPSYEQYKETDFERKSGLSVLTAIRIAPYYPQLNYLFDTAFLAHFQDGLYATQNTHDHGH